MISFIWSLVTALGFTMSGLLLANAEWKLFAAFFLGSAAWTAFPKIPMWTLRQAGRLLHGQRKAAA